LFIDINVGGRVHLLERQTKPFIKKKNKTQ